MFTHKHINTTCISKYCHTAQFISVKCASNAPEFLLLKKKKRSFPFWGLWLINMDFWFVIEYNVNLRIQSAIAHVNNPCNEWSIWHVFSAVLVFYVDIELKSLSSKCVQWLKANFWKLVSFRLSAAAFKYVKMWYTLKLRMANIGLLVLTKPKKLKGNMPIIKQHLSKTLYVQLYPGRQHLVNPIPSNEIVSDWLHQGPAVVGITLRFFVYVLLL